MKFLLNLTDEEIELINEQRDQAIKDEALDFQQEPLPNEEALI